MSEIKNPKITMLVKQTRFQRVIVEEDSGFSMPTDLNELFDMCSDMKTNPLSFTDNKNDHQWQLGETTIEDFNVSIN